MNKTLLFCCLFYTTWLSAQRQYLIDHYLLDMRIANGFEIIELTQSVHIQFTDTCSVLQLDLGGPLDNGLGMKVLKVVAPHQALIWQQNTEELLILLSKVFQTGETLTLGIELKGKPRDGLIISENKYKEPTIFADNWPNRAHYWYACNDHPSDKATYTFLVESPSIYQVVANGSLMSKTPKPERNAVLWHYAINEPIPTKVAVVGVADFASRRYASSADIPINGFVYPQDSILALASFEVAPSILEFYQTLVGPYPFAELNNVQSTTRYGGMENAGCIFYDENSLLADIRSAHLIAHEVAHQWFGNAVSEADWQHLWLSEGFATYLTNMYIETSEGQKAFYKQLQSDRIRVSNLYNNGFHQALVDSITPSLLDRLNANAYQKGAWVLHMLRHEMGDSLFKVGLQQFYTTYKYQNATSQDFAHLMDSLCPKDLAPFFNQWLYQVGHPQLKTRLFMKKGIWYFEVIQVQDELFTFPFQLKVSSDVAAPDLIEFQVTKRKQQFEIPAELTKNKVHITIDPHMHLLFEPVN
jgi:aminopeptidase N